MSERIVDGFFYGLFMDPDVLKKFDIAAINPRRAYVDGYALRIGNRATLISSSQSKAYGMVISLTHRSLDKLYGSQGLEQYRPEAVLAQLLQGSTVPALCYNLIEPPCTGEANEEYASKLRAVLAKSDFPAEYIASIG